MANTGKVRTEAAAILAVAGWGLGGLRGWGVKERIAKPRLGPKPRALPMGLQRPSPHATAQRVGVGLGGPALEALP